MNVEQRSAETAVRVAVLEDHPLVREGLAQLVSHAGMDVVTSSTPAEFFSKLVLDAPTIVVLDLRLDSNNSYSEPSDGRTVLRRIKEHHPMVRALVFSADRSNATVLECENLGAWGFLDKLHSSGADVIDAIERINKGERIFPLYALSMQPGPTEELLPAELKLLSQRERQVLSYISGGADNLKISSLLGITERTVRAHVSSLYRKLGSENRTQLALLARQLGVNPPADV